MEFLKKIRVSVLVLRPTNLIIIAFTLYILQFYVISILKGGNLILNGLDFGVFSFIMTIVAGSGYLINDIVDYKIDLINKPDKTYIGTFLSENFAKKYYYFLVISGALFSGYLAMKYGFYFSFLIYPITVLTLYLYAKKLKSTILIGNIVVSLFVAFVWGILFYVESYNGVVFNANQSTILQLMIVYMLFAFIANLIREVIKDMEDYKGDMKENIITLVTAKGLNTARNFVIILAILFSTLTTVWLFMSKITTTFEVRMFFLMFVILPMGLAVIKTLNANLPKHFHFISTLLKMIMLAGLFGIVLIVKSLIL